MDSEAATKINIKISTPSLPHHNPETAYSHFYINRNNKSPVFNSAPRGIANTNRKIQLHKRR